MKVPLWRRSLAGQFIVFILGALLVGQTVAFMISSRQRETAIRQTIESEFIARTDALSSMLAEVAPDMRQNVLLAGSVGNSRFWLSDRDPANDARAWYETAQSHLRIPIEDLIRSQGLDGFTMPSGSRPVALGDPDVSDWQPLLSDPDIANARFLHFSGQEGMGIVQPVNDGTWLNAVYYKPAKPGLWGMQSLLSMGITAIILSVIGVFVARQIARPLRRLAISAEALGRGEAIQLSPPRAPEDIRQLYEAFDGMQMRLRRFVDDRTKMLAAIGHDLRTPLTTLRLRAEFVSDPELQGKILATVDEMQAMTEATLSFAKSEATAEETRKIDIAALLGSLCDDLAELGHDVTFQESERISYRCRPDNLKRALRNLIENALRYAGKASLKLNRLPDSIEILVEDDGPGIPEDQFEQVFMPFYRLETSRNRETGGVGLGLSIARAIVRHHGGDIVLSPNDPGLRAVVVLPVG